MLGDTFAVALPPVGPLDGILASLNDSRLLGSPDTDGPSNNGSGSGGRAQPAAASAAAQLQPGGRGGRLVYFRVAELQPTGDTAMAVDPTSTAISIHVRILRSDSCTFILVTTECHLLCRKPASFHLDLARVMNRC